MSPSQSIQNYCFNQQSSFSFPHLHPIFPQTVKSQSNEMAQSCCSHYSLVFQCFFPLECVEDAREKRREYVHKLTFSPHTLWLNSKSCSCALIRQTYTHAVPQVSICIWWLCPSSYHMHMYDYTQSGFARRIKEVSLHYTTTSYCNAS